MQTAVVQLAQAPPPAQALALAGPCGWPVGSYAPFCNASDPHWWDAQFNIVASRVDSAAWNRHGITFEWSAHAVHRMYNRGIRIDQVVDAIANSKRVDVRDDDGRSPTNHAWTHWGRNRVKAYVFFCGQTQAAAGVVNAFPGAAPVAGVDAAADGAVNFVYRIDTCVHENNDRDEYFRTHDRGGPHAYVPTSLESQIRSVLGRSGGVLIAQ